MIHSFGMDISPLQFGLAIAVAPVSSLVAALVIYMANNKSGKARADEIKSDLTVQIRDLKTDLTADIGLLRDDVKASNSRFDNKIDAVKADLKESFHNGLQLVAAEIKVSIAESRNHDRGRAAAQGDGD